jgi:hypothetical protein
MMASNRIKTVLTTLTLAAVVMIGSGFNVAAEDIPAWRPLPSSQADGLLAQRVELWRHGRLWHMLAAEDDYLLSGFEKRPGKHPWQGAQKIARAHIAKGLKEPVDVVIRAGNYIVNNWLHDIWGYEQKPDGKPSRHLNTLQNPQEDAKAKT